MSKVCSLSWVSAWGRPSKSKATLLGFAPVLPTSPSKRRGRLRSNMALAQGARLVLAHGLTLTLGSPTPHVMKRSCSKSHNCQPWGNNPSYTSAHFLMPFLGIASRLAQTCRCCCRRCVLRLRHVGSRGLERFEHHRRDVLPAVFVQPQSLLAYHGVLCNSFKPLHPADR